MRYFRTGSPCPSLRMRVGCPLRRDFASAGRHSSRFRKRVPSLRMRVGVPASTGLCKRRAKPESGPRETGRRSSSEGNSSYPTSPACPLRRDFASAGSESEAHSSNSPGTGQNHNLFDINMLEIQGLPGDTNLASPGKQLFAIILIIRWLQIGGLPGVLHE